MGLFDFLFSKKEQQIRAETEFRTLTAYAPHFTAWDGCVYENELVRASIDAIARHFSKLVVEFHGAAQPVLMNRLKHQPNEWSTWSQFLYRSATILNVQDNCVIVPIVNQYGETVGIYPIVPDRCSVKEFKGKPYLRFEFRHGEFAAIELERCGILTRHQYKSDFFGDRAKALGPTLDLMHLQNEAIKEGVKNSATYRFMATIGNFTNAEDLAAERKRFTEYNLKSGDSNSGFLLFPSTYKDIRQIESKPFVVDADQQKLIQTNVFDYFGVNEKIIQNSASQDEIDAFFSGCIEPLAVQMSEVLTKMLFTTRERSNGNYIEVSANRMSNMSISNKVGFVTAMVDRGMLTVDEVRDMFGFEPMPDGKGNVTPIRGEYHYLENAEVEGESTNAEES